MEAISFPAEAAAELLAVITKGFAPCSVYVFGYRSERVQSCHVLDDVKSSSRTAHHFEVLVLTAKVVPNGGSNLGNAIAEQSNKTITATVLLHKVTDLGTKQAGQQWFFDYVLRGGQRLCLDKRAVPYVLNNMPARDIAADRKYWDKCVGVAQFNLQAAADSPQVAVTLCKIALLNSAAVQLALGLIRVFMGYTPNEYGLKYLLQLCGHFTDVPRRLFEVGTAEGVKRYKMLCAPPSMLLHWTKLDAPEEDFEVLLDGCHDFLRLAKELVVAALPRLETISPKTTLS